MLFVLIVALCFALNNRESTVVSLWPFGVEVVAPLYILSPRHPVSLACCSASRIAAGRFTCRTGPKRWRLRRDISGLRDRLEDMRLTGGSQKREALITRLRMRRRFWDKRS